MTEVLTIGGVSVEIVKKDVKNVHLTVHPPDGRVRISAPRRMKVDTLRLYAISKLAWIRRQQAELQAQAREPAREYLEGESHMVWGKRYLLKLVERDAPPVVELGHRRLVLSVRRETDQARRHELVSLWYREQVRSAVVPLMAKWAPALGVAVAQLFVRRMKTKWGSCNPKASTIRLNTELAKKPVECLEYVLLHELAHLLEPKHDDRFRRILDRRFPHWTQVRDELNRSALGHVEWGP
jgi:predicted metal-dependent hydrolase